MGFGEITVMCLSFTWCLCRQDSCVETYALFDPMDLFCILIFLEGFAVGQEGVKVIIFYEFVLKNRHIHIEIRSLCVKDLGVRMTVSGLKGEVAWGDKSTCLVLKLRRCLMRSI